MAGRLDESMPIYVQIMNHIRRQVVSGRLKPGDRMPSVRELAVEFGVNPNTMQRALTELERSGLVFPQRTAGRFVTEDKKMIDEAKRSLAEQTIRGFLDSMSRLGYMRSEIVTLLRSRVEEESGNADI